MTFLKSIFAGLVVLALAMLAKPLLVRALQLNAAGGTTPPLPPPRSRTTAGLPAFGPGAMPRYDSAAPQGRRLPPPDEPQDMLDAVINVRRIEGRINAATTKRVAELLQRHPDLAAQAMRRWLAQRGDSR